MFVASMFVELKLYLFNKIILKKIIKHIVKAKQTYIERSFFHYASYLQVNGSHCKSTLPWCSGITLDDPTSWVDACASGVYSWLAPNNSWLSTLLLEELVAIMSSQCVIDFSLGIYTN
jgi:hypothetical protein